MKMKKPPLLKVAICDPDWITKAFTCGGLQGYRCDSVRFSSCRVCLKRVAVQAMDHLLYFVCVFGINIQIFKSISSHQPYRCNRF